MREPTGLVKPLIGFFSGRSIRGQALPSLLAEPISENGRSVWQINCPASSIEHLFPLREFSYRRCNVAGGTASALLDELKRCELLAPAHVEQTRKEVASGYAD